ncbi:MAG: ATP-binding protein, partial [Gammaproteobacteria bacterium]|nr:ATP-binding protein [Gammaproteobacteria bacterium]
VDAASRVARLATTIASSGEPILVSDDGAARQVACESIPRFAGAPVTVEERVEGVLLFASDKAPDEAFTAVDLDILQLMAQWIGREIERQRTEERAAVHEAELNHVSRLNVMGELATGLAHEINQPLTAIANYSRGCVHRLQKEDFDRADLLNAMQLAVNEAERASAIIRHLREFLATGDAEAAPTCLNSSVEAVLRLAGAEAQRRRITIATNLHSDLPKVEINTIQLEQVILNLLNNAIEAIASAQSEERSILLSTGVDASTVVLTVTDSGPGLSAADKKKLFDPFFTTKRTGMGLGLSISRSIIDACGGDLTAFNELPGGATFRMALPVGAG